MHHSIWTELRAYNFHMAQREEVLRWVHTCNVTAYRKAITLQVTDTMRSYELRFHPVPHGVTVACERYTMGFPVCYGSRSDVFAASSGFVHLCIYIFALKKKRKEGRFWQRQLYTSGSSLLADLNFQYVGGLYKNFTIMSPSEYEFLFNLIGGKYLEKFLFNLIGGKYLEKGHSVQDSHFCSIKFDTDAAFRQILTLS